MRIRWFGSISVALVLAIALVLTGCGGGGGGQGGGGDGGGEQITVASAIIPGLGNNLYDACASAMTITEAREKKVDFSDPYFNADQSLMVQSGSPIKSIDDIGDSTVGVQLGTTGELKAKEFKQQGKITGEVRTFDTITEAFSALE